jgi:hypothetical protein
MGRICGCTVASPLVSRIFATLCDTKTDERYSRRCDCGDSGKLSAQCSTSSGGCISLLWICVNWRLKLSVRNEEKGFTSFRFFAHGRAEMSSGSEIALVGGGGGESDEN